MDLERGFRKSQLKYIPHKKMIHVLRFLLFQKKMNFIHMGLPFDERNHSIIQESFIFQILDANGDKEDMIKQFMEKKDQILLSNLVTPPDTLWTPVEVKS